MFALVLFTLMATEPSGNQFALDYDLTEQDCKDRKAHYSKFKKDTGLGMKIELECIPEGWEMQNWLEGGK